MLTCQVFYKKPNKLKGTDFTRSLRFHNRIRHLIQVLFYVPCLLKESKSVQHDHESPEIIP